MSHTDDTARKVDEKRQYDVWLVRRRSMSRSLSVRCLIAGGAIVGGGASSDPLALTSEMSWVTLAALFAVKIDQPRFAGDLAICETRAQSKPADRLTGAQASIQASGEALSSDSGASASAD